MAQLLLIPDPKPLVERLGPDFFRQAPETPGVYLMRDAAATVLYVGKAKNLRKRLASYRVANPQRLKRRQLRLLRAVERIDFEQCPDESTALARESELLRSLRPRFNRAGVWPGPPRFLAWRIRDDGLELAVMSYADPGWVWHGPLGAGAIPMRIVLTRLTWSVLMPGCGLTGMPEGWFEGRLPDVAVINCCREPHHLNEAMAHLSFLADGNVELFATWVRERTAEQTHPFDTAVREADLESVVRFFPRAGLRGSSSDVAGVWHVNRSGSR